MKVGLEAAIAEVNRAGGIKGRKLELKSADDGYEPTRSIGVVKKLLNEDKVFAIVGTVGTPTAASIQPIASNAGVPLIGAFTGAEFLREPYKPLVMNIRASYYQETEAMVEHLTRDLGYTRIGIMYPDDAYGQAGLASLQRALDKRKMKLFGEGTYERNTVAIKGALLSVRKVAASITEVNKGANETSSASSQVLSSAQSLSGESNRLKLEVDRFLETVRTA